MKTALDQNLELLRQGIELLEQVDDALYPGAPDAQATSYRVGPHLRHCVDAYGCLIAGLATRRIDYDGRQRRAGVETDREAGRRALQNIAASLEQMRGHDPHMDVQVKVDTPAAETDAWSRSTLRRELQFLVGHTVHHFALIAMILRSAGFEPGREFGVAPSTLRHWARQELMQEEPVHEEPVYEEPVAG